MSVDGGAVVVRVDLLAGTGPEPQDSGSAVANPAVAVGALLIALDQLEQQLRMRAADEVVLLRATAVRLGDAATPFDRPESASIHILVRTRGAIAVKAAMQVITSMVTQIAAEHSCRPVVTTQDAASDTTDAGT